MASKRPAPPPGGDWRRRMRVRGGRLQHAMARFGALIIGGLAAFGFGLLGMIGMAVSEEPSTLDGVPGAIAILLVMVMFVGIPAGLLVGLPVQLATRAWLRSPSPDELAAMRAAQGQARPVQPPGLRPGSWWAGAYEDCVRAVTAYHAVVRTTPDGPARSWFADVGRKLDWQLDEALRLAVLGESLDAGQAPGGPTAVTIAARLEEARAAFGQTTEQAASIALDLRSATGFADVRAQLDTLAAQAPHLRTET
ncbi:MULTISPECIES: hypothetical protein [Pseudonocardia]|uniref:Uncharacterized protein n=3 Tax=Pseudonocardia TaxID=1847 RepID=A0A1Y2MMB1_PSEAH|nr:MULTISPECIES: hypothetical protein [Pseudonocardia]OSY36380.1 hypothetical protein BG845_05457 [Pseudonocardia autotrophica]TDN72664.1 hypothetical protein C8E95_1724 [Pseudonocardia autotrophica]BBG03376.1 hypothetical protein Pdca_45850 [Pseudonocardia autotrophica]GEC27269.1 hypothetical protein PSA01_42980 [Pseudonocardia saturnea]